MIWKLLAVASIAVAFAATAKAECGADHGTTVSSEAATPAAPGQMAATTPSAGAGAGEQASPAQPVRQ